MENDNEIFEAEIELQDGTTKTLRVQEVDSMDWDEIPKGKTGLIQLVNGQAILIEVVSADYDGVSFRTDGGKHTLHYNEEVIANLFIEAGDDK